MERLPKEIVIHILSFLNFKELISMERVNHFFEKMIKMESWNHLTVVMITYLRNNFLFEVNYRSIKKFLENHHFSCYDFSECVVDDALLTSIHGCQFLDLSICQGLSYHVFNELANNNKFKSIALGGLKIGSDALKAFKECDDISLAFCDRLTDMDIPKQMNCVKIDLSNCNNLTDNCLQSFTKCKFVYLQYSKFTDVGISALINCEALFIDGCNVTGSAFSSLPKLRVVSATECHNLQDRYIKDLKHCKRINLLDCPLVSQNSVDELRQLGIRVFK